MSGDASQRPNPTKIRELHEVRGVFETNGALQDAVGRLTRAGFDRADLSIPDAHPASGKDTPEQGAANPNTDDDKRQMRTLQASLAGSVGAMAAAGVVIATGGAAIPAVAAAAAAGLGAGGLASVANTSSAATTRNARDEAAGRGELVLSVRIAEPSQQARAESEMRAAGAADVAILGAA